ncbi:MAG: cytochrome C oxidase subunit IV family protein [Bdellovibrionales bacterium]|nr:cytochrome C oxidase subunit IV family protein [Bdellovibrionales bacterium]
MGSSNHHVIPFRVYLNILLILLLFTVVTVVVSRIDFGAANAFIAMFIASIKAGLVLLYFMHLKYDDKLFPTVFFISIFFLLVMFAFSHLDIITRVLENNIL